MLHEAVINRLPRPTWHLFLLNRFSPTLPELALLPLDGLRTIAASKLWLHFDHTGPNGVSFTTGLVAL